MAFSIKELESLSGIKAHTIRIWEQRYHFLKPCRTTTNIRTYSNEELKTLLTVALLNKYGYKISTIDDMPPEQRKAAVLSLVPSSAQVENTINNLIGCMIDLQSTEFESVLNGHVAQIGLAETISTIIFQFLEKVGILWQTNRINPAHEHIVTNIIRQKIIAAIDGLPFPSTDKDLYLLFLPESEYHELGLLFIYYLLKEQGKPILYLGANVPVKDVDYVVQQKAPSTLYLHLTSFPGQSSFQKYLHHLSAIAPNAKIVISGIVTGVYTKEIPQNVTFLKSLQQVRSYINVL